MVGVARRHGQPSHPAINTVGPFLFRESVYWSAGECWWSMNSHMNMNEEGQSPQLDSMDLVYITLKLKAFRRRTRRRRKRHFLAFKGLNKDLAFDLWVNFISPTLQHVPTQLQHYASSCPWFYTSKHQSLSLGARLCYVEWMCKMGRYKCAT